MRALYHDIMMVQYLVFFVMENDAKTKINCLNRHNEPLLDYIGLYLIVLVFEMEKAIHPGFSRSWSLFQFFDNRTQEDSELAIIWKKSSWD